MEGLSEGRAALGAAQGHGLGAAARVGDDEEWHPAWFILRLLTLLNVFVVFV